MKNTVLKSSTVVATKDQISRDLSGETVIINLTSGMYYGLNSVGSRIWNLIQTPMTVNAIKDVLLKEYDVELNRCESDLLMLLDKLVSKGLVKVVKDETSPEQERLGDGTNKFLLRKALHGILPEAIAQRKFKVMFDSLWNEEINVRHANSVNRLFENLRLEADGVLKRGEAHRLLTEFRQGNTR